MKKFAVNGMASNGMDVFKVLAIRNHFATFEDVNRGDVFRRVIFHTANTEWCAKDMELLGGKILPM